MPTRRPTPLGPGSEVGNNDRFQTSNGLGSPRTSNFSNRRFSLPHHQPFQRGRLLSGSSVPPSPLHSAHPGQKAGKHDSAFDNLRAVAGDNGYHCAFDSFPRPDGSLENVVVAGFEGGLRICSVTQRTSKSLGFLLGLPGSVIGAKILDWPHHDDPCAHLRPLIAVILHGPVLTGSDAIMDDEYDSDGQHHGTALRTPAHTLDASVYSNAPSVPATPKLSIGHITEFETTVRVYSLKTKSLVSVLYKSAPVAVNIPAPGVTVKPPPEGDLHIHSEGRFLTVSSGQSGEVFVFTILENPVVEPAEHEREFEFGCIGKLWTSTHRVEVQVPAPAGTTATESSLTAAKRQLRYGRPLIAASPRLLALCPPSATQHSLNGTVAVSSLHPNPAGLADHVNPVQPVGDCVVDMPDSDTFINRVSKQLAERAIKGASWLAGPGLSTVKSYLNKPVQQQQQRSNSSSEDDDFYPPTHANFTPPAAVNNVSVLDDAVVSIYDLDRFLVASVKGSSKAKTAASSDPVATFAAPLGCSFLSFSPYSLHLMTVSSKGNYQFVWDLLHMGSAGNRESSPYVRQISRMARLTETVVIDVTWSSSGDHVMVLSRNGTIHTDRIPRAAFSSPLDVIASTRDASSGGFNWFPPTTEDYESEMQQSQTGSIAIPVPSAPSTISGGARSRVSSVFSRAYNASPWLNNWGGRRDSVAALGGDGSVSDLDNEISYSQSAPTATQIQASTMGQSFLQVSGSLSTKVRDTAVVMGRMGRKAVASGLNKGYIATTNSLHNIRHRDENKVRTAALATNSSHNLLSFPTFPSLASMGYFNGPSGPDGVYHLQGVRKMKWVPGFGQDGQLMVVFGGKVEIYRIERGSPFKEGNNETERAWAVKDQTNSHVLFCLPIPNGPLALTDLVVNAAQARISSQELDEHITGQWDIEDDDDDETKVKKAWKLRHPLTGVEPDTCPFRGPPDMTMMVYDGKIKPGMWAFGVAIPSMRTLSERPVSRAVQYDNDDYGKYRYGEVNSGHTAIAAPKPKRAQLAGGMLNFFSGNTTSLDVPVHEEQQQQRDIFVAPPPVVVKSTPSPPFQWDDDDEFETSLPVATVVAKVVPKMDEKKKNKQVIAAAPVSVPAPAIDDSLLDWDFDGPAVVQPVSLQAAVAAAQVGVVERDLWDEDADDVAEPEVEPEVNYYHQASTVEVVAEKEEEKEEAEVEDVDVPAPSPVLEPEVIETVVEPVTPAPVVVPTPPVVEPVVVPQKMAEPKRAKTKKNKKKK